METALAQQETTLIRTGTSMFFNVQMFEHMQRVAQVFSKSTMVPDHFRGNIGNILIALNFSERIGADPFMVMQNMYVIHGKPGIEGKLVIALLNNCGRFDPLEFEESTTHCTAFAKEIRSGKELRGPRITIEMAKKEGWWDKKGSKWKTIPELMFRYRAATYFARTYAPEVLLGMQTTEEIRDTVEMKSVGGTFEPAETTSAVANIQKKLEEKKALGDPLRAEYINLRSSGFQKWVNDNLDRISDGETFQAGHVAEIREKWGKLYGEPFPGDAPEPAEETPPPPDDPPPVDAEPPQANGNGKVWCPESDGWKPAAVCEQCKKSDKCQKYQEFQFENAQG